MQIIRTRIAKNKYCPKSSKNISKYLSDTGHNKLSSVMGSGITLTNKKECIIKVIKPLKKIGEVSLKIATEKISSQEGGFLGNFLAPLMKVGLPLMKYVLTPLDKKYFEAIRINSSSVSNRRNYSKNIYGSGTTTLIISNEEIQEILKIVKSLKESGLLIKGVNEAIENVAKNTKRWTSLHLIKYISR